MEAYPAATELPARAAVADQLPARETLAARTAVAGHGLVAAVALQMLYSRYCPGTFSQQQHRRRPMYDELVLAVAGHELVPAVAVAVSAASVPGAVAVVEHRRRPIASGTLNRKRSPYQ